MKNSMKKNGMVALLLMGSISMYGQTTSKMTLSGRVKGFTDFDAVEWNM